MSLKRYIVLSVILISLLVFSGYKIHQQRMQQVIYNDIVDKGTVSARRLDIQSLKNIYNNNDVTAVLQVAGANVVLVKGTDNEYYLKHALDKSYNILGAPFIDYRTPLDGKKVIIYGHNSDKYETALKVLENYIDPSFYRNNSQIVLTTENGERTYEIFSVAYYHDDFVYFDTEVTDYDEHFQFLKKKSIYSIPTEVTGDDNIIVLQTCSNTLRNTFIVVSAKEIEKKLN